MKLHLPTRLRSAVLACISAVAAVASTVGTGAVTTGVVAYTLAVSQANAAYNPSTHTFEGADNANFGSNLPSDPTDIVFNMENTGTANWSNGFTYAGNVLIGADGATDKGLCLNNGNMGQVLTLSGKVTGTGLISKKGAGTNVTLALTGDATEFTGDYVLDATVAFTLRFGSGSAAPATTEEVGIGGTGAVTFKTGNNTLAYNYGSGSTVHVTNAIIREGSATSKVSFAGGANYSVHKDADISELSVSGGFVTFRGTTVLGNVTGDSTGALSNAGALTLNGTVALHSAIMNNGSVTLGDNVKFDLTNMMEDEGVYTLFLFNAVDLSALTEANLLGTKAGYTYTFGTDGTITSTMVCQNLTWTGGALTWEVGATIGEGTFADGDIVNFTTADADVTLGEDVNSVLVNIDSGVEVTLSGAHTLTTDEININGTLVMEDAKLDAKALKLAGNLEIHSADNLASGTAITHVGNAATVTVADTELTINGLLNGYNGKIVVEDGATVKMGAQSCLGATSNTIKIEQGGVLDINGQKDHEYTFTLNGGSLVNNGTGIGTGSKQIKGLNVTANSEIGGTGQFGVIGSGYAATTVNLNGNTLTKTGTNTVNIVNTTVTAGTLRVEGGTLQHHNSSRINCDVVVAGGNFTGDACSMEGDHILAAEGAGGTIGCNITSTGAITMDTAAGSTLTMSGALTTTSFAKTGEGTLNMTGALTVSGVVSMNYEGSMENGGVTVADGIVLSYGAADLDSVMELRAASFAGKATIDIFSLTQEQLQAGIDLGIVATEFDTSNLTIGGLSEGDYSFETKNDHVWLKATKAAESAWDKNWGSTVLAKSPATVNQLTITDEDNFLATKYAESSVIAVQLTASEAANNVYGGILNTGVTQAATTEKDVWIDVTGGTYGIIAGGNNCVAWQGSSTQNFEGDSHIQLKGGSVAQIIGGNYKDGFSPSFKGSSYISVMEGSNVTGNIIGGNTSAHSATSNFTGDSHIFVYTVLSTNSSGLESLGNAWIIGGSSWIANAAGGTQNFIGNTNVTIDLSDYTGEAATFVKTVVGGNFTAATGSTVQSLSGDSHVTVKGTGDTTFSGWIIAGARSSTLGTNTQSGNAEMLIDGGLYTGNVVGGFYQNGNATTTLSGTAALTIKDGTFSNDVRGGSQVGGGTATLGGVELTIEGGSFAKDVIAGMYNNVSNTHQVTVGDTTVTMSNGTVTGNLVGGSRLLTGDGLMTNGNISVEVSGGSVAANIIGGDYISGAGNATLTAGIGDIAVTVSGGSVKDIYGGSNSARNYAAGTIAQGDVSVSLTGGTVTGDVYVGGYQGGSTKLTSKSTTLEIGSGATLTEGKTLSGGYKPYNATFDLTSTVAGSRTLKLTTDGTQDLSGMTVKDFDTVDVVDAKGVVTIAGITQSKGTNAITKTGAGMLTLGAGFKADTLTVSAGALDITSATALDGALTLGDGATLQTSVADTAMGVSGLTLGTGMTLAITGADTDYTDPIKLLSGLTEAAISGLTFVDEEGTKYADIAGIFTVTGVSEAYNRVMLDGDTLTLVSSAAPVDELAWLGGTGTWNDTNEVWTPTEGSDLVAYSEGAVVTIGGESAPGGTITVSGTQKAKSVTFASDGYTLACGGNSDTLTISGNLTVNEGVTAKLDFIPTVGGIVINSGATLETTTSVNLRGNLPTLLSKISEDSTGTLSMKGAESITDANRLDLNGGDVTISGVSVVISDSMAANAWNRAAGSNLNVESSLTVGSELRMESNTTLNIKDGASVTAATLGLGHTQAGNPGHLVMEDNSSLTVESISSNTGGNAAKPNTMDVNGGTLTITGETAFSGEGVLNVNIGAATITNGEKDMAFNHDSTLTGTTIEAQEDTTITVGGEGKTTTLAGAITTKGSTALAGTVTTTGMTALNNEGDLSVGGDISVAGLNNTGTMDVTGKLTLTNAPTAGGTVSAANAKLDDDATFTKLTVTGTATVAEGKTLTVGDGTAIGTLAGDTLVVSGGTATITADTALSSLTNNGTLNVTNGLTLDSAVTTGGTISAGSLTLTDDGKLTGTALTTAAISFEALDKNAPLTLGTLSAASDSIAFTVADADLTALGNGATATLAVLNNAYSSGLTLNGSTADYTIGAFTYTISASGQSIIITSASSAQGWVSTDGKWDSSSSWGEGEPGVSDTAYFLGGGTASVELDGNQSVGKVQVSVPTDGSGTQEYTFTGDKLTVAGDVQVDNGTLTVDNETSVGGDVVVNVLGTASAVAVGENGTLDIAGDLILNTTDKTVDNKGTLVIGGEADFTMTGEGSIGVGAEGEVTLQGATTVKDADVDGSLVVTGDLNVETINGTGSVDVGEHTLTLTGDNGNGGDVTAATVTVSGTNNSLTSVTATDVTVSGAGNALGDLEATTLTLNAIGTTVADMDVTTLVFNTLDDTDSAMTLTGSVTATDTVLVKLGEDVITMLCGTTGTQEYTLIDGTIDLADFELDSAAVQALNAVSKTLKLQVGSLELVVADMGLGDLSWNVGSKKSEGGLDISDDGSKLVSADILDTIENVNVNGTKTIDLTDISGDVKVRNLTGNAASDLTIKGNGDDNVALLINENQDAFAAKGTLQKLTLDNVAATSGREGSGAMLEIGELELTGGASLEAADLVVDSLNAADAAAGSVSGIIEVAGQGGIYKGAYAAPTTIAVRDGSQLALATDANLTVEGDGSDVTLLKSAAPVVDMAAVRLSNSKVKLGNMTGTTLLMANPSEMVESTITMGVTVESVESGNTGAVISAPSVSLYNSALVITQADPETTTMTLDPQIHKFVLAQVDGYEGDLGSVTLTGPAFNKYFTGAAIDENGEVTAVRNQHYFSETLLPEVTAPNAKAGLAMLDAALLELNPQGTAPEGALAGIMDALETHTAGDPQKLAASVAGSGLAGVSMAVAGDVERQLRAIRNRTTTMGVDQCVVNEDMPYVNAWLNAEGDYAKLNAEGTKAGYTMSSWGGTVGFDVDCTPRFTCGMALSAMYGDFKSTDVDQIDGDINNYYVSAFARYSAHRWTHTGVATFGISDLTLNRTINYGMGTAKMKGDTNGTSFGAMYEVGYVMALDEDMTTCLQPIANITFRHIGVDGYTESGSDAALKVDDMDANIVTFGLGARLQSIVGENIYNRSSIFECRAMLKLDAGDTEGEAKTALKALNGHGRTVKGAEMGNVGFEIGAGLTVPVGQDAGSIFIDASAEFRSSYSSVNGTVGYRINF